MWRAKIKVAGSTFEGQKIEIEKMKIKIILRTNISDVPRNVFNLINRRFDKGIIYD